MEPQKTPPAIGTNNSSIPSPQTKKIAPTLRFIDRYKERGSYPLARDLWTGIIRQDFSTRDASIQSIRKLVERTDEVRKKIYITPDFEESYRLKRLTEALELVIEALQRWHYEKHWRPVKRAA